VGEVAKGADPESLDGNPSYQAWIGRQTSLLFVSKTWGTLGLSMPTKVQKLLEKDFDNGHTLSLPDALWFWFEGSKV